MEKEQLSAYKKTERLLYSIPKFEQIVEEKKAFISQLEEHGIPKKSKDIIRFFSNSGTIERQSDAELAEAEIARLAAEIVALEYRINLVYEAVETVRDDKYFDVIPLYYWERKSLDALADEMCMQFGLETLKPSTVSKNKTRLVNKIKTQLFPVDDIEELFTS